MRPPSMVTLPLLGPTKPRMVRSSVVLPDPLVPISPLNSPDLQCEVDVLENEAARERDAYPTDRENFAPAQHGAQCPFCRVSVDTFSLTALSRAATSASIHV